MSDSLTTLFFILGEATVFFVAVLLLIIVIGFRSRRKLKMGAKEFVKRIKSEGEEHSKKLKNILMNEYSLNDQEALAAAKNLIEQENSLYSKIIALYLGKKDSSLFDIDDDVKNLVQVMHSVISDSSSNEGDIPELNSEDNSDFVNSEIERLQKELSTANAEKELVTTQLEDAMNTMEGMMSEYASMYSGGGVNADNLNPEEDIAKVKDKIQEIKGRTVPSENSVNSESKDDLSIETSSEISDLDIDNDI